MTLEHIKKAIRNIPDFPIPGIQFKDITTAISDGAILKEIGQRMYDQYKDKGITKVIGIESRGFIMGGIIAEKLGVGFVPIRKKGKLPATTLSVVYGKEYGEDEIEMHQDSLSETDIVLVHDDLLATGGTMQAAEKLIKKFGVQTIYFHFLIELDDLNGRENFISPENVSSMIHF
ncbi:MAG: adenine phosphoribosyltransferase [Bacteroidales bacterium]|jgi:adenine phosphoribosyltransferase|nr:adenine phosphoribosyltransferase [Bacteroidales bacterium]MDD3166028.1 adenine phosphoribosyltransferase [Bacteroidales bacterium]MDD4770797.1 adenine phosphoribosyltransferase [Bacteroidales bacterium]HKL92010.1 adenine phosphoribosyltransferase [Bacteroidales bacterium]